MNLKLFAAGLRTESSLGKRSRFFELLFLGSWFPD